MSSSQEKATAVFKTKERSLFNNMLVIFHPQFQTMYDNKQFKQSFRTAEQILEKHPDHPGNIYP